MRYVAARPLASRLTSREFCIIQRDRPLKFARVPVSAASQGWAAPTQGPRGAGHTRAAEIWPSMQSPAESNWHEVGQTDRRLKCVWMGGESARAAHTHPLHHRVRLCCAASVLCAAPRRAAAGEPGRSLAAWPPTSGRRISPSQVAPQHKYKLETKAPKLKNSSGSNSRLTHGRRSSR